MCGALTGAVMALSLKYGRTTLSETENYEKCMAKTRKLLKSFEETFGSILCWELTSCDLTTAEGRQKFKEEQIREKKCTKYVAEVMRILLNLTRE